MGYMISYKRLDNLCRDMYNGENGVTAYIEDMEQHSYYASYINGWKNTYDALKHYRYIRNQIAHDEYATEENMTSQDDIDWLDNFYQQIINQSDPLSIWYKRERERKEPAGHTMAQDYQYRSVEPYMAPKRKSIFARIWEWLMQE
jgi:hypothetical protein